MENAIEQRKLVIYDLVGIGIGPFNLGLAALSQPIKELNCLFIDQNKSFNWHPGLLLANTTLQVPFIADLVTFADPQSPYSFINYLHVHNRLYKFYFYENFFILREEYNHYCQWVAQQLDNLKFNTLVTDIKQINTDSDGKIYQIFIKNLVDQTISKIYSKHIALGIGTSPQIPAKFSKIKHPNVLHSANFLKYESRLRNLESICIVGSGQSAGEIVLELLKQQGEHPRQLTWLTRANGFFPMEYSKLGLEHFSPDYMTNFYQLDNTTKRALIEKQGLMYKGISKQTIADIFDELYRQTIANKSQPLNLLANTNLDEIDVNNSSSAQQINLHTNNLLNNNTQQFMCDAVILATGYAMQNTRLLNSLKHDLIQNNINSYALNADFSLQSKSINKNKIFMQNNSLNSHGVGSPDLGLGCHRNIIILNSILGYEYYITQKNTVFQNFNFNTQKGHECVTYTTYH
ncbi:MAG: lysine 6-monooxygenase [Neisseriaceae bacterium]|nr:MAG: lysine 6-monooxygenase [Neisseriaceae bacterium]